ncbi:MAG: DUF692 domain-containing protein [Oceanibaculum sp.]
MPTPAPQSPRAGVGLRPPHYRDALADPRVVDFVEVHPENYFCAGGPAHAGLGRLRADLPVSFHGIGLSLGGAARPDPAHLSQLRALVTRYQPFHFSEHLAWSSHGGRFFNDLLPLPYTRSTLARMAAHVAEVQEVLARPILIENPSLYVAFAESEMSEADFLTELVRRTGCRLLLDLNNLHVSAVNAGRDPFEDLATFPLAVVSQLHLAGHTCLVDDDGGDLLIDTHSGPVADPVWQLYARVIARRDDIPVLIEWDNDLPAWPDLVAEADRARHVARREHAHAALA